MTASAPRVVGRQLLERRVQLDLTQQQLADRIGISARTVSAAERGSNQIIRSRRAAWERALRLKAGTIGRAYREGAPIEIAWSESTRVDGQAGRAADAAPEPVEQLISLLARLPEDPEARYEQVTPLMDVVCAEWIRLRHETGRQPGPPRDA